MARRKRNYEYFEDAHQAIYTAGYRGWWDKLGYGPNSLSKAKKHLQKRILRYPFVPHTGTALELGCGDGIMTVALARHGYRAAGIDIAPSAIEKAQAQAREFAVAARFVIGDTTDMPQIASGSAALALDMNCLHCLPERTYRRQMLREVRRILAPGGVFYITTMTPRISDAYAAMFEEDKELRSGQRFTITKKVRDRSVTYDMPLVKRGIFSKEHILGELLAAGLTPVRWQHRRKRTISDLHVWSVRDDCDDGRPAGRLERILAAD